MRPTVQGERRARSVVQAERREQLIKLAEAVAELAEIRAEMCQRPWHQPRQNRSMNDLWPLFDLRIETPRLTIRYPNDEELALVAQAATAGIHEPESMPFSIPWSRAEPPMLQRNILQFAWSCRGTLSPTNWQLPMVVFEGDRAIGFQDLFAQDFPTTRAVETGSWLIKAAQGRGIGKEMRAAVLHLAFEHLSADEAYSASFEDNPASAAVSVANGYQPNGTVILAREGRPARSLKWTLTREQWLSQRRDDINISGIAQCLELLGADQSA